METDGRNSVWGGEAGEVGERVFRALTWVSIRATTRRKLNVNIPVVISGRVLD